MRYGDEADDKMSINVTKEHLDGSMCMAFGIAQFVVHTMLS